MFAAVASALALLLAQASAPAAAEAPVAPPAALPPVPPQPPARPDPFVNPVTPESLALGRQLAERMHTKEISENATAVLRSMYKDQFHKMLPDLTPSGRQNLDKAIDATFDEYAPEYREAMNIKYSELFARRLNVAQMKEELEFYNSPYARWADPINPPNAEEKAALTKRLTDSDRTEQLRVMKQMTMVASANIDVGLKFLNWMQSEYGPTMRPNIYRRFCAHAAGANNNMLEHCLAAATSAAPRP